MRLRADALLGVASGRLSFARDLPSPADLGNSLLFVLVFCRLFLLGTGTGLAPWMSVIRDPDVYDLFNQVVVVHSVRRVSDLAYRDWLESKLAEDPLVDEAAANQLCYVPTVTREDFHTRDRINVLIDDGRLFKDGAAEPARFDPEHDRIMLCGSMAMIKETAELLEGLGFTEGSNAHPGDYVIERAFVG